jgi:peptidoglycan/LPS O-acetylase OafA/YrhL
MLFYALFTIALLFRRRVGVGILLGFFPIVILLRSAVWPLVPYSDPTTPLTFWSDPITLLFVIGVLIGLAELRRGTWHQVRHPIAWTMLVFAATIAIFIMGGGSFPMPIWWQCLFATAAALSVFLCTSGGGHRFPKVGRWAEAAGDASYSTYLLHPLLLMVLAAIWDRLPVSAQNPALFVLIALPLCNLAGYVSFRLVERPLTRWLSEFTGRRRPPVPVAA